MNPTIEILAQSALRSAVISGLAKTEEELFALAERMYGWQISRSDIPDLGRIGSAVYKSRHGFDYWLAKIQDDELSPEESRVMSARNINKKVENRVNREP